MHKETENAEWMLTSGAPARKPHRKESYHFFALGSSLGHSVESPWQACDKNQFLFTRNMKKVGPGFWIAWARFLGFV